MLYTLNIIIFVVVFVVALGLVYFYANKRTTWFTITVTFIGWLMGFLIIVLLPLDIYVSTNNVSGKYDNTLANIKVYWNILYWTAYAMCWTLLPLLCSYLDNGHFTIKNKFLYAVQYNLCYYTIAAAIGFLFLVSLLIAKLQPISGEGLLPFLVSLGSTWGLFQIVFFLAHGLVEVPLNLWRKGNFNTALEEATCNIARIEEQRNVALSNIQSLAYICESITPEIPEEFKKYHDQILEEVKEFKPKIDVYFPTRYEEKYKAITKFTYDAMTQLHYDVIACSNDAHRVECLFKTNVEYALKLEDCISNENSSDGVFHSYLRQPRSGTFGELLDKLEWLWEIKVWPVLSRILGITFGILSIVIIISECTLSLSNIYDKEVFTLFKKLLSGTYASAMVCTLLLMGYLCFCTFYGIFNFKVSGFYGLYPYHQTDPSNLVYSALYLAKLAAPLCVNFLMLIHFEKNQGTVFDKVAGRGMSWSFVNAFLKYFPCLILVLCLLYYFEVYSKVMKSLGLDEYTYYNFYDPEQLETGIHVLREEKNKRLKEMGNNPKRTSLRPDRQGALKSKLIDNYII